jgi:HEAT repeat protein
VGQINGFSAEIQSTGTAVAEAITRLSALREGDRAVLDLIALGRVAIPELRDFLFRREPSGLFEPRCNAVSALASLRAEDVLLDFLEHAPAVHIADPIERTGEDAVINAAARALRHRRDDACFAALMDIAKQGPMAGVIEALGDMGRDLAIPRLIEGLSSDFTRGVAGAALSKFSSKSRLMLIAVALNPRPAEESETTTSRRMRWSALGVLADIGLTPEEWSLLKLLMDARDVRVAALTCRLALFTRQPLLDQEEAFGRLIRLLRSADWLLTMQIEGWLAENYDLTLRIINRAVDRGDNTVRDETVRNSLLRVIGSAAARGLSIGLSEQPETVRSSATNCPIKA